MHADWHCLWLQLWTCTLAHLNAPSLLKSGITATAVRLLGAQPLNMLCRQSGLACGSSSRTRLIEKQLAARLSKSPARWAASGSA